MRFRIDNNSGVLGALFNFYDVDEAMRPHAQRLSAGLKVTGLQVKVQAEPTSILRAVQNNPPVADQNSAAVEMTPAQDADDAVAAAQDADDASPFVARVGNVSAANRTAAVTNLADVDLASETFRRAYQRLLQ